MALISPTIPTIGQPNSTEDQDLINALNTIIAAINGGLDTANLAAAAGVTATQLASTVQAAAGLNTASTRRGYKATAAEESRTDTAYGLMPTGDRVQNVVLPSHGLIFVAFRAQWKESVVGAARAALFLGSDQVKVLFADPDGQTLGPEASHGAGALYAPLVSNGLGLAGTGAGDSPAAAFTIPTTGLALGSLPGGSTPYGGVVAIEAAAGTYEVGVRFKASSGSVTARDRKLWVWSAGFD